MIQISAALRSTSADAVRAKPMKMPNRAPIRTTEKVTPTRVTANRGRSWIRFWSAIVSVIDVERSLGGARVKLSRLGDELESLRAMAERALPQSGDRRVARLPLPMMRDERSERREEEAETADEAQQRGFHDGAEMRDPMLVAHPRDRLHQAERDMRDDAAILAARKNRAGAGCAAILGAPAKGLRNREAGNLGGRADRQQLAVANA